MEIGETALPPSALADVNLDSEGSDHEDTASDALREHSAAGLHRTHTLYQCRFLGDVPVDAPASAKEVARNISRFKTETAETAAASGLATPTLAFDKLLCLPRLPGGRVHVLDGATKATLKTFSLRSILFCASACDADADSLGFTTHSKLARARERSAGANHPAAAAALAAKLAASVVGIAGVDQLPAPENPPPSDAQSADVFEAHLFVFPSTEHRDEAMSLILQAFGSFGSSPMYDPLLYKFDVALCVEEIDAKGAPVLCPFAKGVFKVHANQQRRISVTLVQQSVQIMAIERAFQLELTAQAALGTDSGGQAPSPATLPLEMVSAEISEGKTYVVTGQYTPADEVLSVKESSVGYVLTCDLMFAGLEQPVQISREIRFRVCKTGERFWFQGKRDNALLHVDVKLAISVSSAGVTSYALAQQSQREPTAADTYLARLNKKIKQVIVDTNIGGLGGFGPALSAAAASGGAAAAAGGGAGPAQEDDDGLEELVPADEPIISGTGTVQRAISASSIDAWSEVIGKWESTSRRRLTQLARNGIPDALRYQVWSRLVGAQETDLSHTFQQLLKQESEQEQTIRVDLTRTFPAHEFFNDASGNGQAALYNISKAYSVYDEEVGYCQGLSFIIAELLLHMPEEEAFGVFVKIMSDFGLRELYKSGFANLKLKFFQLSRLTMDLLPDLHAHFVETNVEVHMFASQWLLTLFAAKFPLPTAYRIMDVFLVEGTDWLLSVAVALLKNAKKDLLAAPFEDIMQYFRVTLPRSYTSDEHASQLINTAVRLKITAKRLKKYEEEYFLKMAQEAQAQDPTFRLESENKRLTSENVRLEAESSMLAHELVTEKIAMRKALDSVEADNRALSDECGRLHARLQAMVAEADDERARMQAEAAAIKEMYRQSVTTAETEKAVLTQTLAEMIKQHARETEQFDSERAQLERQARLSDAHRALDSHSLDRLDLQQKVHETELVLATTRLRMADAESKAEGLEQQIQTLRAELEEERRSRNPLSKWFKK